MLSDVDDVDAPGDKREQILREAQKLFAERGYRETNLTEVAERMGFRRQAIYHYFKSKDEILEEHIFRAGQALEESANPIFDSDLAPSEKLAALVRNHVEQVLRDASVFRIQFEELDKMTDERGASLRAARDEYARRVAAVIADGQASGEFVEIPPMTQALLVIGMCNWTIEWYGPASHMTVTEVANYAARAAVFGARIT